ncbi:MAG TPA: hypothetical protein VMX15_01475, partial [Candidatus Heimdallarchaeota archaeon]|nr:hypothetical protein [Candidatus Heimdallarchaeota archaeon]
LEVEVSEELEAAKARIKELETENLLSKEQEVFFKGEARHFLEQLVAQDKEMRKLKRRIERCREVMSTGLGRHLMGILDGKA